MQNILHIVILITGVLNIEMLMDTYSIKPSKRCIEFVVL